MPLSVDCYFLPPTVDVPNNRLPVLHYKNALPNCHTEDDITNLLTAHKWEKRGTWGHIPVRHFHPNTHECYGIFAGQSKLLLGQISSVSGRGVRIDVTAGDVIVLPAGTAHCNLESSPEFRYIGVYPEDSPRWRNETGKKAAAELRDEVHRVDLPKEDPLFGPNGPLMRLWRKQPNAKL